MMIFDGRERSIAAEANQHAEDHDECDSNGHGRVHERAEHRLLGRRLRRADFGDAIGSKRRWNLHVVGALLDVDLPDVHVWLMQRRELGRLLGHLLLQIGVLPHDAQPSARTPAFSLR
jgi:hypothetical protein